jgi:hypothetical protein
MITLLSNFSYETEVNNRGIYTEIKSLQRDIGCRENMPKGGRLALL